MKNENKDNNKYFIMLIISWSVLIILLFILIILDIIILNEISLYDFYPHNLTFSKNWGNIMSFICLLIISIVCLVIGRVNLNDTDDDDDVS